MAFPCLSLVLDRLGEVLISNMSNNIETFVCDGSVMASLDLDT